MRHAKIALLAACLLFVGCSSTNRVTMNVQEPPRVLLPDHMRRVGVIDRTVRTGKPGSLEAVDDVLSAKTGDMDRLGASAGMNGLVEVLSKNERIEVLKRLPMPRLDDPAYGVFPAPLQWENIEQMCTENDLDGLFSLEWFDTDTSIDYKTHPVTKEGPANVKIPLLEHVATVRTTIKTGWRIYDSTGKTILDEYELTETVVTTGRGINPVEAVEAVTGRTEAVQSVSGDLGRVYGESVLPYWRTVSRKYYVKGTDSFATAKRRAQTGNWEGAAELWRQETQNSKTEIAGRAHYNMAIIHEIRGEIDEAIDWARTAYEDFGDRLALHYLRVLQNRKERIALLSQH